VAARTGASTDGQHNRDEQLHDQPLLLLAGRIYHLESDVLAALPQAMTSHQYRTLLRVRQGHTSVGQLARLAVRTPATLSQSVEALVRRGLLTRQVGSDDRRTVVVSLTAAGEQALDDAQTALSRLAGTLEAGLSSRERTALARLVESLTALTEDMLYATGVEASASG